MPDAGAEAADASDDEVVAALLRRAQAGSTVASWAAYADGLAAAGQFTEAIDVRQQVDE